MYKGNTNSLLLYQLCISVVSQLGDVLVCVKVIKRLRDMSFEKESGDGAGWCGDVGENGI